MLGNSPLFAACDDPVGRCERPSPEEQKAHQNPTKVLSVREAAQHLCYGDNHVRTLLVTSESLAQRQSRVLAIFTTGTNQVHPMRAHVGERHGLDLAPVLVVDAPGACGASLSEDRASRPGT